MKLNEIAQKLVAPGKGILAADESIDSAGKRLADIGLDNTELNRQRYRNLFLATKGIDKYLTGVILHDETIHQNALDGRPFVDILRNLDILPGIKVDMGLADLAGFDGEQITHGLDTLAERCAKYAEIGAKFTKWRTVIHIGEETPTAELIHTNAVTLAQYARIVQDAGMVPILEPEVLLQGDHSIQRAEEVTQQVLREVFYQCSRYRVDTGALILKTSMVVPGSDFAQITGKEITSAQIAEATLRVLSATTPTEIPGIVFLSGGQTATDARTNLNAINALNNSIKALDYPLTFSFARAIQQPPLHIWKGDDTNLDIAKNEFIKILQLNSAASLGEMK